MVLGRSCIASTSASTLDSPRLYSEASSATKSDAHRPVRTIAKLDFSNDASSERRNFLRRGRWTAGPAWLLLAAQSTIVQCSAHKTSQHPIRRAQASVNPQINVSNNLPIQLLIVCGGIVVLAMLITTLACFCRRSPRSAGKMAGVNRQAVRKSTWSPGGASSIYTDDNNSCNDNFQSSHGHSAYEKKSRKGQSTLSPTSPMPMLKDEKAIHGFMPPAMPLADDKGAIKMPAPTAVTSSGRQTGWQLFDNPVPVLEKGNGGDVEAAALPPARRPSFIDRLLTHRADPSDSRLPTNNHLGRNPVQLPSGRKASGSGLFSVLSGPMIGFSHSLRNNQSAAKELAVIDSDFEGTIGGKDGEIPMAKRIQKNQGRFACDASTNAPSPCFNERPSDHFSPLPPRFSALYRASPHTPGLAGVGATWARRPSMPPLPATAREPIVGGRIASFAELQRQPLSEEAANRWAFQSTIDNWMRESQNAGKPPPSRRESTNSFLTAHSSSTSVVTRKLPEDAGVERMMSIRPRFAPMTTLSSWLKMDDEDSEVAREEDSIFEKYIAAGSEVSAGTDFDRKRGRLWEGPPPYQPSELSQPSPRTAEKNAFASPLAPYLPSRCQEWSVEEEAREEERRQIDRRQAYLLRQKIKAERRLSRQRREQAKHMEAMAGDSSAYVEQRHRMHCILDMEEMYGQSDRATTHFEAEQHRLRLAPSLQSFHAPVLSSGDQIVAQARRQSAPYPGLADRSPVRVYSLSPPESPLTSASETEQSHRRGYFLVQSNRSRSSAHSGSLRSISHGSGITLQRMPDQQRDAHFNMSLRTQRPQQDMDRCISEHDKLTCVDV